MRGNNFVLFDKLPLKRTSVLNKCFNLKCWNWAICYSTDDSAFLLLLWVIVLWNDRSSNEEDHINVHVIFDDQKSWLFGWLRFYCNIPGRYDLGGGGGRGAWDDIDYKCQNSLFSIQSPYSIACEMAPMYSGMNKKIGEQSKLSVAWGSKKWWGSL